MTDPDRLRAGRMETQGYGQIQYINTLYPWDGHAELRPPEIDWDDCPVGSYVREFDLTPHLREAGNRLCVEVCKRSGAAWIDDQGFFRFSGIFRPVYLCAKPAVHLVRLPLAIYRDLEYTISQQAE